MSKEKAPGQLVFPAKISEVDGFIECLLESYGTIDLLENCEWSNHGQTMGTFNLAVYEVMCGYRFEYDWDPLPAEQLPVLKPSPLVRGSDGTRSSQALLPE